jgi:hypothetical protein
MARKQRTIKNSGQEEVVEKHEYSDFEKELLSSVINKFRTTSNERDKSLSVFDGLNIKEYIAESVHRVNTNIDERENIEDWQARVHDPFTRNKVFAILGRVVQELPLVSGEPRFDEDFRRAEIVSNLYEFSEEHDDYENFMTEFIWEAVVKGTAIGYEGHDCSEYKIRNLTGSEEKGYKIKEETVKENKLYAQVVPLEEFYPASVGIKNVAEQPYCFWRREMTYSKFLEEYGMYKRSHDIMPHSTTYHGYDNLFYKDWLGTNTEEGNIEVILYYSKSDDEYVILANGVWLNPIVIDEKEEISPLPWKHKMLPFFDVKNELYLTNFFYGKSLPDKLKSLQDVMNVLQNMLLDQSFISIFKPIITAGGFTFEDDFLRPGRQTPIDTGGLPIDQVIKEIDISTPSGWHQFIVEYVRRLGEEASIDSVSQGRAGVGERTTAQEIRVAAEGVISMLGLLSRAVRTSIKRKAELRVKNILDVWTRPESAHIMRIMGDNEAFNTAFSTFEIEDIVLSTGERGKRKIEFYKKAEDMPTIDQAQMRGQVARKLSNSPVEILSVPAEYIRNAEVDFKLVPNPKSEQTKSEQKSLTLEFTKVMKSFFPTMVNDSELAAEMCVMFGKDPSKILTDVAFRDEPEQGAQEAQVEQPMSQLPAGNEANNAVRGMRSAEI